METSRSHAYNRLVVPDILDGATTKALEEMLVLATIVTGASSAFIHLKNADGQWTNLCGGGTQEGDDFPFCNIAQHEDGMLVVEDAMLDKRFMAHQAVAGLRFYAGIRLLLKGRPIGVVSITDNKARIISNKEITGLSIIRDQIQKQIDLMADNYLLRQAFGDAQHQKTTLEESNQKLQTLTHELVASETEVRIRLEEIKQLQANIEIREKQYRELVEKASDLIYELDESGRFSFVNATMEATTGYSIDHLRKKYYWELVHPGDVDFVREFYKKQLKEQRETTYLEFRMQTFSGKDIWIGQNVRMYFNEKGYVFKVASISRDITDLKHTEHKLEESEKLYRLLSMNSKDLIGLFDADERVTRKFVSPSVRTILQYEPEELVGKSGFDCVFPEDVDRVKSVTREQTLKGHSATIEYRAIKKDGTVIWLESSSSPIFDSSGKVTGFQTAARDVTSRKNFEVSLKSAKDRAEIATNSKSQFLSMMSHEIRTPMNAIIGLTTLMLEGDPKPDQVETLKLLRFSGENLLTIINDILDFSKIEANKIKVDSVEINLRDLLFNTKSILEQKSIEKGLSLNLNYDNRIPAKLYGDPVRISQIITNLAGNAIKFTEKGLIEIDVRYDGESGQQHDITFRISDTGIGIAPDKLESIFDRFSQGGSEITRKFGGTGLGLSITKSLLTLMGSSIKVESAPGAGSTFSFTLSLREVADPGVGSSQSISARMQLNPKGMRILLVEDNKVNQVVATGFLKRWGILVDIANNGAEAVAMVQSKAYDVVLMDLQMPVMDGYEACAEIRKIADPYFEQLPILALTASAMMGMKDKVLNAGMTDFITKPFSPDELRSKILKYAHSR